LEAAVAAYRAALQERTREDMPLHWAITEWGLGNALKALGEREGGTARLSNAVNAYESALAIFVSTGSDRYAEICRTSRDRSIALLNQMRR
jgi:hypothetical protein